MRKKLEKLLQGIMLGASLLFPASEVKSSVYNVPVQWGGMNFQTDYLDKAKDGDIFRLVKGEGMYGTTSFESSYSTDKKIVIDGNNGEFGFIRGTFTIYGNGQVNLRNSFIQNGQGIAVDVRDNAVFFGYNSRFASTQETINYNSTGGLSVVKCYFSEPERFNNTSINLEKVAGTIAVTESLINYAQTGIRFGAEEGKAKLNILNNTFIGNSANTLEFTQNFLLSEGNISNNIISESNVGIRNYEYAGNVVIDKNNLFANTENYVDAPPYDDYYFNPNFIDDNLNIDMSSPLVGLGKYIEGQTTWFQSPSQTYIGYSNPYVPEPATLMLIGCGLGIFALKRKNAEHN